MYVCMDAESLWQSDFYLYKQTKADIHYLLSKLKETRTSNNDRNSSSSIGNNNNNDKSVNIYFVIQ